ncbi:MAG: hypothetical protein E7280_06395 [Lachnospiraceae bacterium]|jgi:hypothetical protein|nr:hypothetical protein [Lachnospiraceae bacterium]
MPLLCISFFILIVSTINFFAGNTRNRDRAKKDAFWAKESAANAAKDQDLSTLSYITLSEPLTEITVSGEPLSRLKEELLSFRDKTIVNLNGISNTDLKLTYGANHIGLLSQYDQNFTDLCICLQNFGKELLEAEQPEDAVTVLEYAVSIGSDITDTYVMLAYLYLEKHQTYKIDALLEKAEGLNSLSKDTIILKLKKIVHP